MFKQKITIGKNVTAIMNLPCVCKAEKLPTNIIAYTLYNGKVAVEGDCIVQYCDRWDVVKGN